MKLSLLCCSKKMDKNFENNKKNLLETGHLFYASCKLVHSEDPANRNRLKNVNRFRNCTCVT